MITIAYTQLAAAVIAGFAVGVLVFYYFGAPR